MYKLYIIIHNCITSLNNKTFIIPDNLKNKFYIHPDINDKGHLLPILSRTKTNNIILQNESINDISEDYKRLFINIVNDTIEHNNNYNNLLNNININTIANETDIVDSDDFTGLEYYEDDLFEGEDPD